MAQLAQHSKARVKAYLRLLRNSKAPARLIKDFGEVVEIDNALSLEGRVYVDSLDDHFFHTCLRHNFSKPFDKDGEPAHFRPEINHASEDGFGDTGWLSSLNGRLDAEQSYRRGFDQGFADAEGFVSEAQVPAYNARMHDIRQWRVAKVWYGPTAPGTVEQWMPKLKYSRSISPKLRFDVFERDNRRCVVCGDDAKSGAVLEVDHIVPVAKGGTDDLNNLQTLCWACNSGKGAR